VDGANAVAAIRPTVPGMPAPSGPFPAPVVPGFVLEELLGRGGSGQVWRARPRAGGPPVAVKVLVRGDPERQEREAALLAELDHPHLVRLHRVVRHEVRGRPAEVALVLDLLAGGSLAALLARRGRLRPGEVVTTVAPIAAALAHAHERGVVHGDLSPGNVVFTAEGRPVLTDLGTARLVGDTAGAEVTPAYVDPVVARGGAPGPASDVFGVAAAAFHALTGIAPWNAADPRGTLTVAAAGDLPDLALLAPEAPEELVRVVQRGLSLDPHRRGTAAAFALDLRHACRPEPVRLPEAGVPDAELGMTGRGARTELTHQVPGRRPRAAHSAPVSVGRLARVRARLAAWCGEPGWTGLLGAAARRLAVVGGVLLAVAVGVTGAAWAGARWGGQSTEPVSAAGTATPSGSPVADPGPRKTAASSAVEPSGSDPGGAVRPTDEAGWTVLVTELYARRTAAFAGADPAGLARVYRSGSALLERDTAAVQALRDAGQVLVGYTPEIRRLQSVRPVADGQVELVLVDDLPGYRVEPATQPDASVTHEVAGRGEATVRIVLVETPDGWRIADARLSP
jgi:hypothetical protein